MTWLLVKRFRQNLVKKLRASGISLNARLIATEENHYLLAGQIRITIKLNTLSYRR